MFQSENKVTEINVINPNVQWIWLQPRPQRLVKECYPRRCWLVLSLLIANWIPSGVSGVRRDEEALRSAAIGMQMNRNLFFFFHSFFSHLVFFLFYIFLSSLLSSSHISLVYFDYFSPHFSSLVRERADVGFLFDWFRSFEWWLVITHRRECRLSVSLQFFFLSQPSLPPPPPLLNKNPPLRFVHWSFYSTAWRPRKWEFFPLLPSLPSASNSIWHLAQSKQKNTSSHV